MTFFFLLKVQSILQTVVRYHEETLHVCHLTLGSSVSSWSFQSCFEDNSTCYPNLWSRAEYHVWARDRTQILGGSFPLTRTQQNFENTPFHMMLYILRGSLGILPFLELAGK